MNILRLYSNLTLSRDRMVEALTSFEKPQGYYLLAFIADNEHALAYWEDIIHKFYFSKEIIIHKYYSKSAIYYLWLYYILWLDLFCPHSEYYILYQKILEYTVEWIKFTNTFICKFFLNNVPLQFQIVYSSFSCNPLPISGCSVCIFLLKN